ncbi:MAG: FHA domain-containing protein [Proteobacteria bacterium]|nr:FHA domain-containing protein [Pseudomonadota bacterium]
MTVCPRCGKQNQPHYKFCLGCGSELPRGAEKTPGDFRPYTGAQLVVDSAGPVAQEAAAVSPLAKGSAAAKSDLPGPATGSGARQSESTEQPGETAQARSGATGPGADDRAVGEPPEEAPRPSTAAAATCPNCGSAVPGDFKFCGTCGHSMSAGSAPATALEAPPAAAELESGPQPRGLLTLINPDGSAGGRFPLSDATTQVGRDAGEPFALDSYLSPVHATFSFEDAGLVLRDEGSLNGVYLRLTPQQPVALEHGSVFRIGQEVLKFELMQPQQGADGVELLGAPDPGYIGRISLIVGRNVTGNAFPIGPHGVHLGRERGDVLFPEDGYVSGLHCRVYGDEGSVKLADMNSSNGTFLRVSERATVEHGSMVLMGQQLFRIQIPSR